MGEAAPTGSPSPPEKGREGQARTPLSRRQLAEILEKSCGWIRDIDTIYQELKHGFDKWPESKTLSRYKLYGYLLFGDAWIDAEEAANHLFYYIEMNRKEEAKLLRFVKKLDDFKLKSFEHIMEVCEDTGNTKMGMLIGDLGFWIKDMAYLGHEEFKKAAEMTPAEFARSKIWHELRNTMKKRIEGAKDNDEKRLLSEDEKDFTQALYNFVKAVPDVFEAIEAEIVEMLVSKVGLSSSDVHHMLKCLDGC